MTKHHYETKQTAYSTDTLLIGTKTGKCDICKVTKKILLLKYGFTLCEDCLSLCTSILEKLQNPTSEQELENQFIAEKEQTSSNVTIPNTILSKKTKSNAARTHEV